MSQILFTFNGKTVKTGLVSGRTSIPMVVDSAYASNQFSPDELSTISGMKPFQVQNCIDYLSDKSCFNEQLIKEAYEMFSMHVSGLCTDRELAMRLVNKLCQYKSVDEDDKEYNLYTSCELTGVSGR